MRAVLVICGLKLPLSATVNRGPDARQNVAFVHGAGDLVLVDSVWSLSTEMGPRLTCPRQAYHIALLFGEKTEEVGLSFSQVEIPEGSFFVTPSSHHSSLLGHNKNLSKILGGFRIRSHWPRRRKTPFSLTTSALLRKQWQVRTAYSAQQTCLAKDLNTKPAALERNSERAGGLCILFIGMSSALR